jgi:transposase-like protein
LRIGFNNKGARKYRCSNCGRNCSDSTEAYQERKAERKAAIKQKQLSARQHSVRTMLDFIQIQLGAKVSDCDREMLENVVRPMEAAKRRGVSRQWIDQLIKSGELKMFRCGAYEWVWQPPTKQFNSGGSP